MARNIPDDVHERAVGVEEEVGGTAGESHDAILTRVLGRERGLDVATKDGPPRPPPKTRQRGS